MAGARGSARRELVVRLFGRRNRRRGSGAGLVVLKSALPLGLAAALVLASAAVGWPPLREAVRRHPYFAVQEVLVRDHHRLPADEIRAAAGIRSGMSIWDVDGTAAEALLAGHRWIRSARVRRELPRRVVIQVREERPLAIVALDGGKVEYYVSPHGRLFAPVGAGDTRDFPYLTGLTAADLAEGATFGPHAVHRALALIRQCGGLAVSEVHVDHAHGLTVLPMRPAVPIEVGWTDFAAKLARLPKVLALWAGRENEMVAVSLLFDDEVIVRTHPTKTAVPVRRAT
jgi:cell division protein FtsQ